MTSPWRDGDLTHLRLDELVSVVLQTDTGYVSGARKACGYRPQGRLRRAATDRVHLSDHHVARHLSGVAGMSHVLEALGGVSSRLLPQHLLSSGVLT